MERVSTDDSQRGSIALENGHASGFFHELCFPFPRTVAALAPFIAAAVLHGGTSASAQDTPSTAAAGAPPSQRSSKPDASEPAEKIVPANDRERAIADQARTEGRLIGKIESIIVTLRSDLPSIESGLKAKDAETLAEWHEYRKLLDTKLTALEKKLDGPATLELSEMYSELKATVLALSGWRRLSQPAAAEPNRPAPKSAAIPERIQLEVGDPASFALWQQLGPLIQGNIDRALRGEPLQIPKPTPQQLEQRRSTRESLRKDLMEESRRIKEQMKGKPPSKPTGSNDSRS